MRRILYPALLPVLALLLSGCFTVESEIVVNDDGAATQTIRIVLPGELLAGLGSDAPSVDEMREEFESSPENAEMREALDAIGATLSFFEEPGVGIGFEMTLSVDASDDPGAAMEARMEEFASAAPSDEMGGLFDFGMPRAETTLRREGDEWIFEVQQASFDPDMLGQMGGDDTLSGMGSMFLEEITITNRLRMPGELVEHNADEVLEDGTLVWTQTAAESGRTLSAKTSVAGGGLSTLAKAGLLVAGLAVALLAAGYLAFGRRRTPA